MPFWWWSSEDLDVDRMIAQVRELHRKGVSGVQVNYSHYDTPGWMTDQKQPPIFSEAWWEVYGRISQVCGELDMGIGLSTYTLDWPRGAHNLFYQLFYSKPELNALELARGEPPEDQRYADWITQYSDPEFVAAAEWLKSEMERLAAGKSAIGRERLKDLFITSCRYELAFWEMCWRGES